MNLSRRRVWEHGALVLIAIGGPLAQAFSSPIYSSGDEAAHVDYALQVWHGQLPVFEDGLILGNTVGFVPSAQWTAQHPPLFYALLAPVVGPLADAGMVNAAGIAARLVVVLLSVALIYAVRATARALVPARPEIALVAPLIVGASVWFTRLGGSVYNDILAATVVAIACAMFVRLLRGHREWIDVGVFVAACAASATTRLSVVPIAVLFAAMLLVGAMTARTNRSGRLVFASAAALLAMLATSGWFYLRNVMLTGSVSGGHPDWAVERTGRTFQTPWDVALDPDFWVRMLPQFSTSSAWSTRVFLLSVLMLFIVPAVVGVVLYLRAALTQIPPQRTASLLALLTIACATGGIAVMQILHVAGAGSALPRYFFALVPFLAPLMALALVLPRRWPILLVVWVLLRLVLSATELTATLERVFSGPQGPIYPAAAWTSLALLVVGALGLLAAAISRARSMPSAVIATSTIAPGGR